MYINNGECRMKKILLIILDGFGMKEDIYGNAIKNAGMTNFINIWNNYPHCLLKNNEEEIGLPTNQCSCSELGHKLLGAGTVVDNKLTKTNDILNNGKIKYNSKFNEMIYKLKNNNQSNLHISFLISDGGISSHIEHLKSFIKELKKNNVSNKIYLHLISDGRDSYKYDTYKYIEQIRDILDNNVNIATICGRYYALDNTKDYSRTKYYYELLTEGKAVDSPNIEKVIKMCYNKKISDEYLLPIKTDYFVPLKNEDTFIFLNFSKFNQVQMLEALAKNDFNKFKTNNIKLNIYSLFEIDKNINKNYFIDTPENKMSLGEYLSKLGVTQARIYESVKKPSLRYFFEGERDIELENCAYIEVESPKINSFDNKPEMNSLAVSKETIKQMEKDCDFIVCNFANPDEVGHTGNYQATINGLQAIDVCLGKILDTAEENFYKVMIVGSHAKADTIIDKENNIVTKNTLNPIPFIIMDKKVKLYNGDITMVAPTILKYLDISLPKEMKETRILFNKK
jgi:2,3-bisphosphoglycerate-independent phosphoglycerate mutase